jgi:hypothetical protein
MKNSAMEIDTFVFCHKILAGNFLTKPCLETTTSFANLKCSLLCGGKYGHHQLSIHIMRKRGVYV